MLKLGSIDINKVYLGSTEINKIYLGADEVFSAINFVTILFDTGNAIPTDNLTAPDNFTNADFTIAWGDGVVASFTWTGTGWTIGGYAQYPLTATGSGTLTQGANSWPVTWTGATVFAPNLISNNVLWLDASDTGTITQSGGAVSQWNDKSGLENNAVQATGARQFITGERTINGLNAMDLDASKVMEGAAGLYGISSSNNTAFVVLSLDNTTAETRPLSGASSGGNTRYGVLFNNTAGQYGVLNSTNFVVAGSAETFDTNAHAVGFYRNGATVTGFYDGEISASGAATNITLLAFWIGARSALPESGLDGRLAEILLYSRLLSSDEINHVGNYLSKKWGTPWAGL